MNRTVEGHVFVLSGPSGVGKDSVLDALARRGTRLGRVITAVTRAPRPTERDGVDYHFLTRAAFDDLVATGGLLEWADYVGSPRGTPLFSLAETLERGQDAVLKIDVEGFRQVRRRLPEVISIFLLPPDEAALERRLHARGDVTPEEARRRLERARHEIAASDEYDYRIVNVEGEIAATADRLAQIIASERARVPPRRVVLSR